MDPGGGVGTRPYCYAASKAYRFSDIGSARITSYENDHFRFIAKCRRSVVAYLIREGITAVRTGIRSIQHSFGNCIINSCSGCRSTRDGNTGRVKILIWINIIYSHGYHSGLILYSCSRIVIRNRRLVADIKAEIIVAFCYIGSIEGSGLIGCRSQAAAGWPAGWVYIYKKMIGIAYHNSVINGKSGGF